MQPEWNASARTELNARRAPLAKRRQFIRSLLLRLLQRQEAYPIGPERQAFDPQRVQEEAWTEAPRSRQPFVTDPVDSGYTACEHLTSGTDVEAWVKGRLS